MVMWQMAAISGGAEVAGGLLGLGASKDEADKARELEWETTQEDLRRMDREQAYQMGDFASQQATSGTSGGSGDIAVADQQREFQRQRDFTEEVGASKAAQIDAQGKSATIRAGAQTLSGLGKLSAGVGQGLGWWE